MKKYELTDETLKIGGRTLHRIRALRDFADVKAGNIGGWIEFKDNLSHDDNAWVYDNACVYGNARAYGDAWVYDNARVYGDARVCDGAQVYGNAQVYGDAWVYGDAQVYDNAWVYGRHALYTVTNIGSRNSTTTFFNCKDGNIGVSCGCFRGSIDEFAQAVKKTHGDNKFAKQYEVAIQLAKEAIETSAFEED